MTTSGLVFVECAACSAGVTAMLSLCDKDVSFALVKRERFVVKSSEIPLMSRGHFNTVVQVRNIDG